MTPVRLWRSTLASTYVNCRLSSGYPDNHGYTPIVGNDRLIKYYCGNDENYNPQTTLPLIRVRGLPASFLADGYRIYVDSDFYHSNDPAVHKFDLGTSISDGSHTSAGISNVRSTATMLDYIPGSGTINWLSTGNPTGIFIEGTGGITGNYLVFTNQTASEFAIFPYAAGPARTAINGIHIVQESAKLTGSVLLVR